MAMRMLLLIPFLLSCSATPLLEDSANTVFRGGLEQARAEPATSFTMEVDCTDEKGIRSLVLFESGAAIWNREAQVKLESAARNDLLDQLIAADFAAFEDSYGGKPSDLMEEAAVKVLCSISVRAAGQEKLSYQDMNGERSAQFMTLASGLLDAVEPLAEDGLRVSSLQEGLQAVAAGDLVAETLTLKLISMPDGKREPGVMVDAAGGQLSVRDYQPGAEIDEPVSASLEGDRLHELVNALLQANYWDMPRRMESPGLVQINVRVLNHAHSVMARSAPGTGDSSPVSEQQLRFDRMLDDLMELTP